MRGARGLVVLLVAAACAAPEPVPETLSEAFNREAAALHPDAKPERRGPFDFLRRKPPPSVLEGTSITVISDGAGPGEEPDDETLPFAALAPEQHG